MVSIHGDRQAPEGSPLSDQKTRASALPHAATRGLTLQGLLGGSRDIFVFAIFFVQSFEVSRSKIASFRYDRDERADGLRAKSVILNEL